MVTPTHFLLIFSKPLGILDTEGKKKIIIIIIIISPSDKRLSTDINQLLPVFLL